MIVTFSEKKKIILSRSYLNAIKLMKYNNNVIFTYLFIPVSDNSLLITCLIVILNVFKIMAFLLSLEI